MQNLFEDLAKLLSKEEKYSSEGRILKNVIVEDALNLEPVLIKLLLSDKKIKKHFFQDIEGTYVFDKIKFQKFISNKQFLPDSYTAFKNKIGLTTDDEYITEKKDVVLSWPYKDCVLEGGQDKEDAKRDEIFWNETLAPDEIDRLLSPKVLTNWKKYDKDGEHKVEGVSEKDNLIIKGNNLLGLSSILKKYRGKVKLIYIDPPYNTDGAANTFSYNNTFNHSSWLTFMKNRLELSKRLLSNDGIIIVAIDHFELFYLGILLDEVFNRENRMGVVSVVHNPGGRQDDKFFPTAHENMLIYAKNIEFATIDTLGNSEEKLSQYKLKDKYGFYKLRGFRRSGSNSRKIDRPGLYYPIFYNKNSNVISLERNSDEDIELLPIDNQGIERCWRWGKKTLLEKIDKYIEIKDNNGKIDLYTKERESDYQGEKAKTIWNKPYYTGQTGTNELKNVFGKKVFSYPKSPFLIRDVLQITTKENDIVLDFFGGSGTTAAVAKEMNRQFITIEQMDYAKPVIFERMSKVINGNKSGISESVNWQGGGSFIYCELAKANQEYIDKIQEAKDTKSLLKIWKTMQDKAFISYKVDIKTINASIAEFEKLPLEDQKRFLIETLDKNMLYVPYSEIDDADYSISDEDKKLNHKFYGGKA